MRARREPLEGSAIPRSFLRWGFSLKRRAQLTFSSKGKVKALCKLDATHLAQVNHSFVRARREPLDVHVDVADRASDGVEPS